jgi:hypothetical protein
MTEDTNAGGSAVWLSEAIDGEARPLAPQAAMTALKEPEPETPPSAPAPAAASEILAPSKVATLRSILKNIRDSIDGALKLLEEPASAPVTAGPVASILQSIVHPIETVSAPKPATVGDERMVEGVFDGEGMVGDDGKTYVVPPNYASKSKLVEGDMLKLTIGPRGNFIYKQIGPIERQRLIGAVAYDQDAGAHIVMAGGRAWRVLKASMTYFKAEAGDEAVVLVPKNAPSKWAAVENVIKKSAQQMLVGR